MDINDLGQRLVEPRNDGPDYTPDGKYIYFDSLRSGKLQIWRMKPDGSAAEQITDDEANNHSPHVAPDGKAVAFLSQQATENGEIVPTVLKVISSSDGMIHDVAHFQRNRGSFQMYGWGDATHLAFLSYQKLLDGDPDVAGDVKGPGAKAARKAVIDRPAITGVSQPDYPELKDTWPFLWYENEYVVDAATAFILAANAADAVSH